VDAGFPKSAPPVLKFGQPAFDAGKPAVPLSSQAPAVLDNLAEQGAAFMLKVFVKPTNEVPDPRGCAPGRFSDAQINA
jgi:hypothetical protein